jgi:hypothetical protein
VFNLFVDHLIDDELVLIFICSIKNVSGTVNYKLEAVFFNGNEGWSITVIVIFTHR